MKTEGKTHIQVRVGNKVVSQIIKSVHNNNIEETDREITEQYEKKEE
ncbi:hypothetical protein ES703_52635 [subsurface metagenome]